jgi:glycosyltransferase involved in cell wall biosynthesis
LKVLFFSYPSSFQNIGGGEILLLKLKEYVEKHGVEAKLFDMWKDKVKDYDVLHVIGSVKDCLGLIQVCKSVGTKVAITPLFWSSWNRAMNTFGSNREKVDLTLRHAMKVVCPAFPSARRKMLLESDLIFPNSEMEKKQISRLFAVPESKMEVVYNGVDQVFTESTPDEFHKRYGREKFILSVGRIEPRKNQLNLIRAVKKMPQAKLVLIGNPVTGFEKYYQACKEEGEGFTRFLPAVGHHDPILSSAYAACQLYALPAWFETPGMVGLEAVLAGAKLASTEGGSTREYYEPYAEFFNPASPDSIKDALERALRSQDTQAFKAHVLREFTWDSIAERTIAAYERLIG